jgi:hypothetical protein
VVETQHVLETGIRARVRGIVRDIDVLSPLVSSGDWVTFSYATKLEEDPVVVVAADVHDIDVARAMIYPDTDTDLGVRSTAMEIDV